MLLRKLLKRKPTSLRKDEIVVFFPSMAYRAADGKHWRVEFHGWVYRPKYHPRATTPFFHALGFADDCRTMESALFEERVRPFLVDNKRNKQFTVRLGELAVSLGKSSPNGHFRHSMDIADEQMRALRETPGFLDRLLFTMDRVPNPGEIFPIAETGLSVISDIDDTIKVTQVHDHQMLIRNTFFKPFEPIAGMPDLFRVWAKAGAAFHYLSATPWQLYGCLRGFLDQHDFPAGTFHLKNFRWKDRTRSNLLQSPERYKPSAICPLLERFPRRTFILIGDSSEKDPEIFADLARTHPNISRILIREVSDQIQKNRYAEAFRGLPKNLWYVFLHAAELDQFTL